MHPPPTDLNVTNPAKNQSQFWWRPFFFIFIFIFLETTWIWAKKTFEFPISAEKSVSILVKNFFFFFWRPPEFGRKKRLNFRFRPKNHSQFWWRHPNFWGFVLQIPPHQNFLDPPLLEAKAKDSPSEDRPSRGQGQECSRPRPRTQAQLFKKKRVFKKIFQAYLKKFFFQAFTKEQGLQKDFLGELQNFNNSKNSAVLEPRTGQFSRTWGFEVKAKDLTFEAKNFKMCPRNQGCPRGLHLCLKAP